MCRIPPPAQRFPALVVRAAQPGLPDRLVIALIEAGLDEVVELGLAIDSSDAVPARLAGDPSGRVFAHAAIPVTSPE
jgi:hypothetical protein